MGRTMAGCPARLAFAALLWVTSVVPSLAFADEPDITAWLVPGASYAGVWKTEGPNAAPDLESQITFGYKGADGNDILFGADGKLAIVYGVNPIGAPNHTDTIILVTRTPGGFKWGDYPARPEFACTFGNEGGTLACGRRAIFQGQEYVSRVEMARVSLEAVGAPPSMAPPPFAPFVAATSVEQGIVAYASEILQEGFRPNDGQSYNSETQINPARSITILSYRGPAGQDVSVGYAAGADGTPWYVAAVIREANIDNARNHITADTIYGTLGRHFVSFPEPFNSAVWRQYRRQDGTPTIERAWTNEDGSVETVGAALWGQNPPNGLGNYLTFRARLFLGSPHHAARTLYPS